jgi:hypothetical protein
MASQQPVDRHVAKARIAVGPFSAEAEASISTRGLLAVAGLVSSILIAVVPIIWIAKR